MSDDPDHAVLLALSGLITALEAVLLRLHAKGVLDLEEAREALQVAADEPGDQMSEDEIRMWRIPIEKLISDITEVLDGPLELVSGGQDDSE